VLKNRVAPEVEEAMAIEFPAYGQVRIDKIAGIEARGFILGGAVAAGKLLERAGANVVGCCFVIDLPDIGGSAKLRALDKEVITLVAFKGA
jgi:adenine/guanine phosphoribosyltransferase-like PRPP-binding protein